MFMLERLPQVRAAAVHERDLGPAALAELVAQPGGELEAAGAAADHQDAMCARAHGPLAGAA
jgi:hypothetical protein